MAENQFFCESPEVEKPVWLQQPVLPVEVYLVFSVNIVNCIVVGFETGLGNLPVVRFLAGG